MAKNSLINVMIFLIIVAIIIAIISVVISGVTKKKHKTDTHEGFTASEEFGTLADLDGIKTDITAIRQRLSNEFPDMSKYVEKRELPPSNVCRVATAVDKDAYVSKTEVDKLSKCPVSADYDPTKYIAKSVAMQSQGVTTCPTLNPDQWVLKSTIPPAQKCKDCICPQVKVSAGLCQKCPTKLTCPTVKPCPVVTCPRPKPCAPQKECPRLPPKEHCPKKVCKPCPINPTPTPCAKCCDREVIKVIKKIVYVDQNGKEISSKEFIDKAASVEKISSSSGSGLVTPAPTQAQPQIEQKLAEFSKPTEKPFVQSYKVSDASTVGKSCKSNAFNSEFQQYGVYGDAKNMYNEYLAL